ncbi:NADPH oxidase 4 [Chanos chanos]|uniref:NADPH oxidase 4 n=1 Tax=Chanos chanos TaxID=29144 RepID=A0A6J2VKH7_CHACN|nr:NADPH oxidase 4 [Chanos chanos]
MALSWRNWLTNEGCKHLILALWVGLNVWLFWRTFVLYNSGQQYHYLHRMLGLGLCISRASAAVLNLNCTLILLPMCRTLLTFIRQSHRVNSRKLRRLLDKSKAFHVVCGVAICVFSVIHVCAHLCNAVNFSLRFSDEFPELNIASYKGQDPRAVILATIPGVTGVLLVLVLFLMVTASSHCIRVSSYEVFWYTHNLFIIFYILLMVHVAGGALKYQTNVGTHPPGCLSTNTTSVSPVRQALQETGMDLGAGGLEVTEPVCQEDAKFQPHFPETWLWVSAPLCLYCVERFYRYIRSSAPVTIVSVTRHPCDVIEVCMLKSHFKARPGQYIVLNCPSVSAFENHPFTLTACPTGKKDTFGIHLRVLGDWTKRFSELLLPESSPGSETLPVIQQRIYPKLYVDGPFGSPSEEVFNYEVSVCVGGGIGVTPFACILQALQHDWKLYKLRRLYFVWVCRELESFYWFADLLCSLHHKLWQENRPDYLNIRLYLSNTQGLQNIPEGRYQPLSSRLLIGRPRWRPLFEEIGRSNQHKKVGVFCCGPKGISKTLHTLCNSSVFSQTTFEYNKESFS